MSYTDIEKAKKLFNTLVDVFEIEIDDKTRKYIEDNEERFLGESFFDEIKDKVTYIVNDVVYAAEDSIKYDELHKNDVVILNKRNKKMYFNDNPTPAYWYKKGMSEEEIKKNLDKYRTIWENCDFVNFVYPMLEKWYPLKDWKKEYSDKTLKEMEAVLENEDSEKYSELRDTLYNVHRVEQIKYYYPIKIKKILKIENRRTIKDMFENDEEHADLTLELYNGEIIHVDVHKCKGSRGMTALDPKGFPMMTDTDDKLIDKEVFGGKNEY